MRYSCSKGDVEDFAADCENPVRLLNLAGRQICSCPSSPIASFCLGKSAIFSSEHNHAKLHQGCWSKHLCECLPKIPELSSDFLSHLQPVA